MSLDRILSDEAFEAALNSSGDGLNPFATESQVSALAPQNALVGGGASWDSGLTFNVTPLEYWLNGTLYGPTTPMMVTLPEADPTDQRKDVIVVDSTGTVSVISGTPAPVSAEPEIDLSLYVKVTVVTVDAGASTPTLTVEDIYLENAGSPAEWNVGSTGGTINVNSGVDPYQGSVSIEGTNSVSNHRVEFFKVGGYSINLTSVVEFRIKLKNAIGNNERFRLRFRDGATNKGVNVNIQNGRFGFDSSNTSDYQAIAIPMSAFQVSGQVTELRIICNNISTDVGFFIDNVRIQEGFGITTGSVAAPDVSYNPTTPGDWGVLPTNVQEALDYVITNAGGSTQWSPTALTLGDWRETTATFATNVGAGGYYNFASGADQEIVGNVGLSRNGETYDGSDIQLELEYMKFGGGGGTILWELDYAFVGLGDDAYFKQDGSLQIVVNAASIGDQELNTATFPSISGPAGSRAFQATLRRNSAGPGSDTYSGATEIYGTNLIRV